MVHRGPGAAPAGAEVLGRAGEQGVEAVIVGQRGLVLDEIQCGAAGFVGSPDEFEEDPQPGLVVVEAQDGRGGIGQA